MAEPEIKKPVDNNELPFVEPQDGVYEDFANVFDADWSLTDVTLRFMQLTFLPKDEGATAKNREQSLLHKASITIPWWQAKVIAISLSALVRSYESVNGELKQPELAPIPVPVPPTQG